MCGSPSGSSFEDTPICLLACPRATLAHVSAEPSRATFLARSFANLWQYGAHFLSTCLSVPQVWYQQPDNTSNSNDDVAVDGVQGNTVEPGL